MTNQRASARTGALLLLRLCRIGERARQLGYCLGELQARDVVVRGSGLSRALPRFSDRLRHRLAQRRHLRQGHDQCCSVLGIPRSTILVLLRSWSGHEAAQLLLDAVDAGVRQYLSGLRDMSAHDMLKYEIGRCLTLEVPADFVADQMPRMPSKFASSKRAFTWLRKRAASAPSTIR